MSGNDREAVRRGAELERQWSRLNVLLHKQQTGGLTPAEEAELESLQKFFHDRRADESVLTA